MHPRRIYFKFIYGIVNIWPNSKNDSRPLKKVSGMSNINSRYSKNRIQLIFDNCLHSMTSITQPQVNIRQSGTVTRVPDNPFSKLQYYIRTVLGLIEIGDDEKLHEYKAFALENISFDSIDKIQDICTLLEPTVFLGKCVIIAPEMCGAHNNEFYDPFQVANIINIGYDVVIKGSHKQIKKIMTIKKEWLTKNFYAPLKQIATAMDQPQKRTKIYNRRRAVSMCQPVNNPEGCSIM